VVKVSYICEHTFSNYNEMNDTKEADKIKEYFSNKKHFTRKDLEGYYHDKGERIKESTLKWRIHDLKKKKIIDSIGRGVYEISGKPEFKPEIDNLIKRLVKSFNKNYEEISYCIWNTKWLYRFMNHQPFSDFYVLETESDIIQQCFYHLKDDNYNIYLQPNSQMVDMYVTKSEKAIIVKPIVSRSPLKNVNNIYVPALEKMIVDIILEQKTFPMFSKSEVENILSNSSSTHNLNISTILSYADRRKGKDRVKSLIRKNYTDLPEKIIL
jgi:hypothetical protein